MEYTKEAYDFLYNVAKLTEEQIAIIKPELDKIVLFKNFENPILIIDKIIESGLYDDFKRLIYYHQNRQLNDPIKEIERDIAGVN